MAFRSVRRLFWRGMVVAAGSVGVVAGVYPVWPQVALALARRRAGHPQPEGLARIIAGEWALAAAMQLVRPASLLGVPVVGRGARGPRPIIVLHGFAQGNANFLLLAHRLNRAGLGPISGFSYWTLGSVERAAAGLDRFIARLGARGRVDLIGHSMGGLVARAYVCFHGGGARVANLITIGSPHAGPAVELVAGPTLTRRLDETPLPPGVRFTSIWSRADGLVSTRGEAEAPGAEPIVYSDLGHLQLLVSRRVARVIIDRLRA